MNKTVAYIIGAVVVVALIVIIAMKAGGPETSNDNGSPSEGGSASSQSLKELFASGTSQRCTFERTESDGSRSSGVVYVAPEHMRGDFTTQASAEGEIVESHMIIQHDTSYMWSTAMPQGIKMSFAEMGGTQSGQTSPVNADQKTDYECSSWTEDHEAFDLPAGVTFVDLSTMMQGGLGVPVQQ